MVSSFLIYDLVFLGLFLIFFSIFLYTRKHNLKRDGLMFLYRTSWGIKLIDYLGNKYKRTLKVLSYISLTTGYLLMLGMFYLTYTIVKIYVFSPTIVRAIKVPPILPLFPYLPQVFNLDFLPPFYFTYWIVIIAVIAITHEMAHGIFAAYDNVKIKTTGFGFFPFFLPIFLAAFVEPDEKQMMKKSNFSQRVILSAGTFANVLTAILFFVVLWIFFSMAFVPSGITFDSYATSTILVSGITSIGGISVENPTHQNLLDMINDEGITEVVFNNQTYLINKQLIEYQINSQEIILYYSAPAIQGDLSSIILKINDVSITSLDKLHEELAKYQPGDKIKVTNLEEEGEIEREITLTEHPERPGAAWMGIGFIGSRSGNLMGKIIEASSFKEPNVYYSPKFDGISIFIYNLLWWMIIISISVALVNMLPVGIFDGGRFFYLTVLGLTKNKKIAEKAFKYSTNFFLLLLLLIMVLWAISFL